MFERTFKVSSESRLAVGACDWLYRIDDDVRALRGAYIGLAHVHTGCVENASHSHIGHIHKMQEEREQFQCVVDSLWSPWGCYARNSWVGTQKTEHKSGSNIQWGTGLTLMSQRNPPHFTFYYTPSAAAALLRRRLTLFQANLRLLQRHPRGPPSPPCLRCPICCMRRPRLCAPQENAQKQQVYWRRPLCTGICLHAQTWLTCSCKAEVALHRIAAEHLYFWRRARAWAATIAKVCWHFAFWKAWVASRSSYLADSPCKRRRIACQR
jgi:hypothetical protein